MWSIHDVKFAGKENFMRTYWYAVVVSLVLLFIGSTGQSSNARQNQSTHHNDSTVVWDDDAFFSSHHDSDSIIANRVENTVGSTLNRFTFGIGNLLFSAVLGTISVVMVLVIAILALAVRLFIFLPVSIGAYHFYISEEDGRDLHSLFFSYQSGFVVSHVITLVKRDIFIFLWSLLFVIPGIIKAYEYRMIPYLLAEFPDMSSEEAFARSREMMYGEKLNAFWLDLSFIGWHILSAITANLAGIFYVNPYVDATDAELYKRLRGASLS